VREEQSSKIQLVAPRKSKTQLKSTHNQTKFSKPNCTFKFSLIPSPPSQRGRARRFSLGRCDNNKALKHQTWVTRETAKHNLNTTQTQTQNCRLNFSLVLSASFAKGEGDAVLSMEVRQQQDSNGVIRRGGGHSRPLCFSPPPVSLQATTGSPSPPPVSPPPSASHPLRYLCR